MDLDDFIKQADELKAVSFDSPKILIWKKKVREFLQQNFDPEYKNILDRVLRFRQIVLTKEHGMRMHFEAMSKAEELLESLKSEPRINLDKSKKQFENQDFDFGKLHTSIKEKCFSFFESKNYSESVEKGLRVVRERLRSLTGYETGSEAFGKGRLHIKGAIAGYADGDFNQGVKFLTMAIDRFRNEKIHTVDGNIDNPQRAYEYLTLCSLTMKLLDNSEILS